MLNKLKIKFALISMLLVGIVLALVITAAGINTYHKSKHEMERALGMAFGGMQQEKEFWRPMDVPPEGKDAMGEMKPENLEYIEEVLEDSEYIEQLKSEIIINSILIFTMGLAVTFLISTLLSNVAVKPVKEAWEQQKRFIADASHELKTPLTVILANNEILLSGIADGDPEKQKKWIHNSQEEAEHMKKLIDDLLFLARSDEDIDGRRLIKSTCDFDELVTGAVLQFEPVMFEAGVSIHTDIAENLRMDCDETQMKQLMHILLDNAVKYAGSHGEIFVGLKKSGSRLKLTVANTGEPVSDEDLKHIFERFYRSDKARTRGNGYGLGLSIAYTIAESHGGSLKAGSGLLSGMDLPGWNISEEKTGTVITAILPAAMK